MKTWENKVFLIGVGAVILLAIIIGLHRSSEQQTVVTVQTEK